MSRRILLTLAAVVALAAPTVGQVAPNVTYERLLNAAKEPQNWLTYSGGYKSRRYSELAQITPENVGSLELKWIYQGAVMGT
jgi:alcohol dehydrogenase (cytochrome c)